MASQPLGQDDSLLLRLQRRWVHGVKAVPLLGWVSYLPLLGTLLGVLLVVAGIGTSMGIPSLIWHDRLLTQLLAGVAVAGLSAHLGMVGYLLDDLEEDDESWRDPDYNVDDATLGRIVRYLAWPCGALFACTLFGLVRQKEVRWHGALVLVGPAISLLLILLFRNSPRRFSDARPSSVVGKALKVVKRGQRNARWVPERRVDQGAHAVQTASMAILALLYVGTFLFESIVPAAVAVALVLALVTGVWGLLAFWMRRYRLLGMGLLVLLIFVLGVTRDAPPRDLARVQLACAQPVRVSLIGDQAALASWKNRLSSEDKPPLVVVATSGGAARAAVWTITVLAELEARLPGFMRHVRIVTGASGGMVGAAHYVSALGPTGMLAAQTVAEIRQAAASDSLTAVTRALILPGHERGSALEKAWEENSRGRLAAPFVTLGAGEREGWRPSLIFAPVMVEDGRRLIISNLDLGAILTSMAPLLRCGGAPCGQSQSGVQLFGCPGGGLDQLRISTAARMNATFPWVTSAALLPTQPARRVVDAGYYDNYGVNIATAWITKNAAWLKDNTSGVLLVQIRDGQIDAGHWNVRTPPGPGYFHEWISALSTPIEAFLNVWESSMSFRNDGEISLLAEHPLLSAPEPLFATTTFEFTNDAPLNWYLSGKAIERLTQAPPEGEFTAIGAWWAARVKPVR